MRTSQIAPLGIKLFASHRRPWQIESSIAVVSQMTEAETAPMQRWGRSRPSFRSQAELEFAQWLFTSYHSIKSCNARSVV